MSGKLELLEAVLESIPAGIIVVDAEERIALVNRAAEEIRHIVAGDILGRSVVDCHPEHSHARVSRALAHLRSSSPGVFTRMVVDHAQGRYYENTYAGVRDAKGNHMGSVVISRDVTDKRRLEEERAAYLRDMEDRLGELTTRLQGLFVSSMSSLVQTLEAKDPYTKGHSMRVSEAASRMAEYRWGVSQETRDVELGGKLHDIGKIGVRESVLGKPGGLTDEELAHVRAHPEIGARILAPFERLGAVVNQVRHHHERFDGAGYPDGLTGEQIPVGARILAIADSYDAMTSVRPYRPPMAPDAAAAEIRANAGTQFDPEWCEVFLELFRSGTVG